jgi:hypothetical protein
MKLFVDDIRIPSDIHYPDRLDRNKTKQDVDKEWFIVRNAEDVEVILNTWNDITEISLDNDLGPGKTGYQLAKWMTINKKWPNIVHIHTSNIRARKQIYDEWQFYLSNKKEIYEQKS